MAIIEFNVDPKVLTRLVEGLERIATVMERAYPPRERPGRKIGMEALTHISDDKLWARQQGIPEEEAKKPSPPVPLPT